MKKAVCIALSLLVCCALCCAAAETTGVAYGIYSMEGEQPDSVIRVTLTCDGETITAAQIDEKLIPYSASGASGWAMLDEETAAALEGATILSGETAYPASFSLNGIVWNGAADENGGIVYTASIGGETVDLLTYACTDEGGAWYFASEEAELLDASGNPAATVTVGTKASINHGEDFWPSELKFSGNIAKIAEYLTAYGADFAAEDVVKGEDGVWAVADVSTGATLAGTPNYLTIAQAAYENAQAN